MMRIAWPAMICLLSTLQLHAQDKLQILTDEQQPRKMLHNFLLAEAQKHFDARRKIIAQLKTPEDIRKRQQELRQKFIEAIGGFPEKTPLNAQVVGTLKGDGFRVEKVIYESRPNHHVTGNLYIPDGKGPFPGVLLPCGHSANGKASGAYQLAAILMAKNGMAVLCYDPIGQGERLQLIDEKNLSVVKQSTTEHTLLGVGALLVGQSTAGYRIWDGIRSIDYLASRPEIHANKLGCTGNSGGGTLTSYLMALDDRVACAAPSCYVTSLERLFATIGPQDAEQNIPGQVALGIEHADYLTMRAPNPTLMCIASQDFFDQQGSWTTFRESSVLYGKLGHGERVGIFEYDDKHGFSKPRREAAMRWMRRWLLNIDDAPSEGKHATFSDAELQCTRSGQVLTDFKGISAFGISAQVAKKYEAQRAKFPTLDEKERQGEIRRLLGMPEEIPTAKLVGKFQGDVAGSYLAVHETEKGIRVYGGRMEIPNQKGQVLIVLDEPGHNSLTHNSKTDELRKDRVPAVVWKLLLRGHGWTSRKSETPSYFGVDSRETFLSQHLNRPLLGQRVLDVLSMIKAIKNDNIHLVGIGTTGPIALHAAALEPRIREITVVNSLHSWTSVVQQPISYNQFSNVVPGVLKVYDLPELAATLAPRPLTIKGSVSGDLKPISQSDLEKLYEACRARYASQNAAQQLKLQAAP